MSSIVPISFSIIIPLYNKEPFIVHALQSILAQTVLPQEVIIVDDCSTDNGLTVAQEFVCSSNHANLFQIIQNASNSGPGITRNNGIEHASSDYILFLDADDQYASTHIESLSTLITSTNAKLVICSVYQTLSKRILPTKAIYNFGQKQNEEVFLIQDPIGIMASEIIFVSANYCFQRSFFQQIRFGQERNFEDWLFCYHLLKHLQQQKQYLYLSLPATYHYTEDDPSSQSSALVSDINRFVLPQLYFELIHDGHLAMRKLVFSIWMFNALKRTASFRLKLKFLFKHTNHIIRNLSTNKYFLSSFLIIFVNRTLIEKAIAIVKKNQQ